MAGVGEDGRTVRTLSVGYEHSFALDEWAETPLKLTTHKLEGHTVLLSLDL